MEEIVQNLLEGKPENCEVLCDYSIADQNEFTVAKGIQPTSSSDYKPIVKKTVTYIVMGVLINDKSEVLMMQEAKESCAGQWYLPAGRMEPGETIEEAVKREVLEETGLEMEPTTLLSLETASGSWYRFVITGNIIGGELKTPAQADSESLQAKWIRNVQEVSLRAADILDAIERGRAYQGHGRMRGEWHPNLLPCLNPHNRLLMRLIICIKQRANNRLHILLSEKTHLHLPLCELYPSRNVHSTLRKFMIDIFGADLPTDTHKPHGLVGVEHCGKPQGKHDGLLLTLLITFRVPLEQAYPIDKYSWVMVSKALEQKLNLRIPKNKTIPLRVLR